MLVKLKDICQVVSGATPSTSNKSYYDGNIFWVTPKDLAGNGNNKYINDCERKITSDGYNSCSTVMIPKKNILISTRAPIGYIAINTMDCCTNQGFKSLICDTTKVCVDYLYYLLKSRMREIELLGSGTTFKEVSKTSIENFEIQLPKLETQYKISTILSLIDNQISRNNAIVKRLQVLSQAIFNRFFASENNFVSLVDFPYIQIIKPGIKRFEGVKHYVATAEVEGEKLNFDSPLIEYETRENRANMQPIKNSVWFAKLKKSIKHIYISNYDDYLINNYVFSTGFCGVKCDEIAFEYVINYLNLPYFENLKDILSHGATQEGINNEDLKLFKINLPTKEDLVRFHKETKEIHKYISKITYTTYKLECLKKKILPLLINGQLK